MRGKRFNLGISLLVAILVVSIVFMGGCTKQSTTEEPSPPVPPVVPVTPTGYSDVCIPIGEFQSGHQHIDVVMSTVLGGELTVTLGSNPTTGFQWSEEAEISDETIVQQTSHIFVGPGMIEKPPGTPGEEVWVFKALKAGTTTISMEYSRPWVGSKTPDSSLEGGREEDSGLWTVTITANIKL